MTRDDILKNENTAIKLQDNEVLRVTAEGKFLWHENADEMIASGDYGQSPSQKHILKALRKTAAELLRLHEENERLRAAVLIEREACAKLAGSHLGGQIAAAIRARSNE